MKIITKTEKETYNYAKNFARTLEGGEIIGLKGELGAGKTIFTKGLAAGLGIKRNVNSPTFVIMKVYNVDKPQRQIKQLIHIDAYRIGSIDDLVSIGAQEYFEDKQTIVVIEWINKIKMLHKFIDISITPLTEGKRKIEIK